MTTPKEMDVALANLRRSKDELLAMAGSNFTSTVNVDDAARLAVPTGFPNPDRREGGP
jgi:hypothetical protein